MASFVCPACGAKIPEGAAACPDCGSAAPLPPAVGEEVSHRIGDRVTFGTWGGEPLVWRILDLDDNRAFLVTEHVIDRVPYHKQHAAVTWEQSTLRTWCNTTFLRGAFTSQEQRRILETLVTNGDSSEYDTSGGNDTKDRVFCLSVYEAGRFFLGEADRRAKPTPLAQRNGAVTNEEGFADWWLRTPGHTPSYAAHVYGNGYIYSYGYSVTRDRDGVRPALWVTLDQ